MKITKFLRFLLIAVAAVMAFSLFACTEDPVEEESSSIEEPSESDESIPDENTPNESDPDESTPDGSDESTPDGSDESTPDGSEESSDTPACQHVEEEIPAVAATCTTDGATAGKKCSVCGEVLTAPTTIPATGHSVATYTTYVANPDGDEALIAGECSVCHETATKPASFFASVESIFGDAGEAGVTIFQASETVTPYMSAEKFVYATGHPSYPANGYAPIPVNSPAFPGMLGIAGWAAYLDSAVTDGAVYKIVDAEGNVIIDWQPIADQLGLGVHSAGGEAIDAFIAANITEYTGVGIRFYHIIDLKPFYDKVDGQTVTIVLAFTTGAGVDGDVYIPYANLSVSVPACEHVAGEPDVADNCNVKCTKCGSLMEANKHSMGAWAVDPTAPQLEVSACACGAKETRAATTTLAGLTVFTPDALLACKGNGGYVGSVVVDEVTGLKYFRAVSGKDATEGNININDYESSQTPIANVGNIAFVIVRKNVGEATIQLMTNAPSVTTKVTEGRIEPQTSIALGGDFQIIVFDVSSKIEDGKLGWLRIDLINGGKSVAGTDTVDVAAFGFAATEEEAYAYYASYIAAYAMECVHIPDGIWNATENEGEIAMTCKVCEADVCVMACTHADVSKLSNITAKETPDGSVYFIADCAVCGCEGVDAISLTQEGKKLFTPAELFALAESHAVLGLESGSNAGYSRYNFELVTEENGFSYIRFTSKVTAESNILLNQSAEDLMGVDRYFVILYKKNCESNASNFEFFYNTAGVYTLSSHKNDLSSSLVNDGSWQLAIIDANKLESVRDQGYGWTRIDIFNGKIAVGDQLDVAYMGFFSSADAAYDYFKGYLGFVDCFHVLDGNYVTTGNVDEMQAKCTICEKDVVVACTHPDKTVVATADPNNFNLTCNICGKVEVTTKVNDQNLTMFDSDAVYNTAKADGGENYSVTQMTEGNLSFVRFETLKDKTSGEWYYYPVGGSDPAVNGISDYFMIVYRASEGFGTATMDFFIANSGGLSGSNNKNRLVIADGEWKVILLDLSTVTAYDDAAGVVSTFRIDIFDNRTKPVKGEYIDIAYMGFFATPDKAYENYFKAVEKYGFDSANFYNRYDAINVNGTNVRDNAAIVTKKDVENGTYIADLSSQTLDSVTSLAIQGWLVTPGGAESVSYRITGADGKTSELKELLKPGAIGSDNGIAKDNTAKSMVYGEGMLSGCTYQGNSATIDLSGYEGQVVTVEVFVITNNGQMGNIINFTNVTVPGTPAAE